MAEEVTAVLRMSKDGTTFGFLLRQIDIGEHVIYKIIENTPADMCAKVSGGCIRGRALGTVCLTAPSPQPPCPSMAAPYREILTKKKRKKKKTNTLAGRTLTLSVANDIVSICFCRSKSVIS